MILSGAICRARSAACTAWFALMTENDTAVNASLAEAADHDLSKCDVCQTSKDGESPTPSLSATDYLKMKEVGPGKRMYSVVAPESDETEVNVLYQSTAQGKLERRRLAEGCCNYVFHQTCLKRRRDAGKDNRWTGIRHSGEKEHVAKDILHHSCAKVCQDMHRLRGNSIC